MYKTSFLPGKLWPGSACKPWYYSFAKVGKNILQKTF